MSNLKMISKVSIVMGSQSDLEVVKPCIKILKSFNIFTEVRIISAHRTPNEAHQFAKQAIDSGTEVIIGVAGKAAHLAGVLAGFTTLPVIALPVSTKLMGGLDSLLSMVQMPKGVPVATVAIDGGENAGILAAQILALKYPQIQTTLQAFKNDMAKKVIEDDKNLALSLNEII